jgi:hypothetical protein
MAEKQHIYRIIVGKHEGKRPLRRPTHRQYNNLKTDMIVVS